MTILNSDYSVVLIIDIQEKLLNAVFNKEILQKKSEIITKTAGILNLPVIITEQYPQGLGSTIESIKNTVDAQIFEKNTFSALDNNEICKTIKFAGRKQIVLYGIETHICVSQTANALIGAGYEVNVISDACGSRVLFEHAAGLDRMKSNGANIITTEIALFEWLRGSKHPNFKEIQALIK